MNLCLKSLQVFYFIFFLIRTNNYILNLLKLNCFYINFFNLIQSLKKIFSVGEK